MDLNNIIMAEMEIKVLGTGCSKCKSLEKATRQAVEELNLKASIEKVEDIQKIMEYGIMSTPGLVVNGKVVLSGKLPKSDELKNILTQNQ
jgi:small redox-active disulfide protein 2